LNTARSNGASEAISPIAARLDSFSLGAHDTIFAFGFGRTKWEDSG